MADSLSLPPFFPYLSIEGEKKFIFLETSEKKTYHDESNVIVGFHT